MDRAKVTVPHLGSYCVPIETFFREGLGVDYIMPPPITERTLALGSRYSPDFVCAPFKYNLGNYLESIEAGADTLVQVGGACRLAFYGELHEQILSDLGYNVKFINMAKARFDKPLTFYDQLKSINPGMSLSKITSTVPVVVKMVKYIDSVEDFIRKNIAFEKTRGSFDRVHKDFLERLRTVFTMKELNTVYQECMKTLKGLEGEKPENPLKVGVIGEYYTIMVPFSNHFIENELGKRGVVVDRWMDLSNSLLKNTAKEAREKIKGYAEYDMGANCVQTIERALYFAKKGYDGIIHVKSFGCTPEMDAMPVLQNISADYRIPIIYLSYDSQTSDEGIRTRLEAFHDMILMRKDGRKRC